MWTEHLLHIDHGECAAQGMFEHSQSTQRIQAFFIESIESKKEAAAVRLSTHRFALRNVHLWDRSTYELRLREHARRPCFAEIPRL
jgi:hypothetical protein